MDPRAAHFLKLPNHKAAAAQDRQRHTESFGKRGNDHDVISVNAGPAKDPTPVPAVRESRTGGVAENAKGLSIVDHQHASIFPGTGKILL